MICFTAGEDAELQPGGVNRIGDALLAKMLRTWQRRPPPGIWATILRVEMDEIFRNTNGFVIVKRTAEGTLGVALAKRV